MIFFIFSIIKVLIAVPVIYFVWNSFVDSVKGFFDNNIKDIFVDASNDNDYCCYNFYEDSNYDYGDYFNGYRDYDYDFM